MQEISLFWLRVAAIFYLPALVLVLVSAIRRQLSLPQPVLNLFAIGALLHLVSLVDLARQTGSFPAQNSYESISLCAFLLAALFLVLHWRYRLASLSVLIFPLVSVMTLTTAFGAPVSGWDTPNVRGAWLLLHASLAVAGYAALFVAAAAAIFYVLQERRLKAKQMSQRLPPLVVLDDVLSRSMGIGFVMITLSTVMGMAWGFFQSGTEWVADPQIIVAWITWIGYLVLVALRVGAGWRGRKVAFAALGVLGISVLTWATHYGLRTQLQR